VALTERDGAFVPGRTTTVQFMVKDSKKYASTGGWGFGRFIDGKPVDEAQHKTCFPKSCGTGERTRLGLYALRTLKIDRK
jgi:Cytochrome P460